VTEYPNGGLAVLDSRDSPSSGRGERETRVREEMTDLERKWETPFAESSAQIEKRPGDNPER
jgi:hypothetical protein